jgi:hypothetical protein
MDKDEYRESGSEERSGVLARVEFKVIGTSNNISDYYIYFENTNSMPGAIDGTLLFSALSMDPISNYSVIQPYKAPYVTPTITPTPVITPTIKVTPIISGSYIKFDYSLNNIKVGSTIDATLSIKDIAWFSAYQVNLRYNPKVLQPVRPDGVIITNNTNPIFNNELLNNQNYSPVTAFDIDKVNGILNFGASYINAEQYLENGPEENTGVLTTIKFKVIGTSSDISDYYIYFEDTVAMPGAKNGTYLFSANLKEPLSNYSVFNLIIKLLM